MRFTEWAASPNTKWLSCLGIFYDKRLFIFLFECTWIGQPFYMCIFSTATVGIGIFISKINSENERCAHTRRGFILWPEWNLSSFAILPVISAGFQFSSSSLFECRLPRMRSRIKASMCKSSWFCVSRLIEHIQIHCDVAKMICHHKHTQKMRHFFPWYLPIELHTCRLNYTRANEFLNCHLHFSLLFIWQIISKFWISAYLFYSWNDAEFRRWDSG